MERTRSLHASESSLTPFCTCYVRGQFQCEFTRTRTKIVFPLVARFLLVTHNTAQEALLCCPCLLPHVVVSLTQMLRNPMLPKLDPDFENLLRNVGVYEEFLCALRVNEITDRETFVGLDETETGMKTNASNFVVNMTGGGLQAKLMAETKL